MTRPIIFLDFDGVLTCNQTRGNFPARHLDPERVAILNKLVKETDARIVLTTSWRHPHGLTNEILNVLERDGLENAHKRVIGQTLRGPAGWTRGMEIFEWLLCYAEYDLGYNFCILDDTDNDMEPLMDKLIKTDPEIGLTEQDALRATARLLEKH